MQYRSFGRLDWRPSALGFGAMRLPFLEDDVGKIDEPEATRMLHFAIEHGVNYVDTAYGYHQGTSEAFLGRALKDGYREQVKVATKMPTWLVSEYGDFDRYLDEQLQRLQTQRIDFYLLHGLTEERWRRVRDLKVLDWAEKAMADGRIAYLGFSFHDTYQVFQEILDGYDGWTLCQIQYNYMDIEEQAGTRGLKYAAAKGLAVVIMEPIRGGQLARKPPQVILDLWNTAPVKRTPADWALQWVWNQPEVSVVLSGMSTFEQVEQNLASADRSGVGVLSAEELALVDRVREQYRTMSMISCTACKYCLPCPSGVMIPEILEILNEALMYNDLMSAHRTYSLWIKEEGRADRCIECGECLEKCPQGIDIPEWLKKADEVLASQPA